MDRESQNIQRSLLSPSIIYGKSHVLIFRKSLLMLIVVGQFHLSNLNKKANTSRVRGNTRECE